jgi:hypothetical protein
MKLIRPEKYLVDDLPKEPAVVAALLTVLLMNLVFHLPRRATAVLLAGMQCMLLAHGSSRESEKLPDDPRTVLNRFDLDPRCSSFLQCPACYALYPYNGTITSTLPEFDICTHRSTPASPPCGVPLWEERHIGGKIIRAPRRKYIHQNLKEWVGRLLTRPGVEELLREPCDKPEKLAMEDIWDAPVFRTFRDPDSKSFFRNRPGELRLAFSLNADGFHPLHKLEAKQTLSCTAVYMVILNFPPHLRYLFRNMYLAGVIPGPGKPSLDQINHFLSLLVLELLDFWRGVFYTLTPASASGLLTKGVLIPLVCDMLAARQLCGLGSATSKWFCTFCLLTIQEIENLDKSSWPPRDLAEQIQQAQLWRDCENEDGREAIFKAYGVRWSALLDLPYWNPILFSVVDSMHAAYLGLFQSHCRKVWQINVSIEGGDGTVIKQPKSTPRPDDRVLSRWLAVIRDTDPESLHDELSRDCPKETLWYVCIDNNIRSAGTRKQLIKNIVKWVSIANPIFVCNLLTIYSSGLASILIRLRCLTGLNRVKVSNRLRLPMQRNIFSEKLTRRMRHSRTTELASGALGASKNLYCGSCVSREGLRQRTRIGLICWWNDSWLGYVLTLLFVCTSFHQPSARVEYPGTAEARFRIKGGPWEKTPGGSMG